MMTEEQRQARVQIQFCGAGGTGKTGLAERMAEAWGIPMVPSVARQVQAEFGVQIEDDQRAMAPGRRWDMQQEISSRQATVLEDAAKAGAYISDRSPLDHLCYALLKSRELMTEQSLCFFEERTLRILQSTLLVVYFPTRLFLPPSDGFRTSDQVEREIHDTLVRGYLHRWRGEFTILPMTVCEPAPDSPPEEVVKAIERSTSLRHRHLRGAVGGILDRIEQEETQRLDQPCN